LHLQGKRFDVGEKLGYMMAQVEIALFHPEIGPAFQEYLRQLYRTLFTTP
jgi:UTP--glucose-1-phosphate uridylyltransferase